MEGGALRLCATLCGMPCVCEGVRESLCTREDNHPFFSGSAVCGSLRQYPRGFVRVYRTCGALELPLWSCAVSVQLFESISAEHCTAHSLR